MVQSQYLEAPIVAMTPVTAPVLSSWSFTQSYTQWQYMRVGTVQTIITKCLYSILYITVQKEHKSEELRVQRTDQRISDNEQ